MAVAFPGSPTVGQEYAYLDRNWIWTGDGWAQYINHGQAGTGWMKVASTVDNPHVATTQSTDWLNKDYV